MDNEETEVVDNKSTNNQISLKLKIFDYIFAGISGLSGIIGLVNGAGAWGWLPFAIAIGLLMHKKTWRIICIVLMSIEIIALIALFSI
jgi:hypothetical protein